VGHRLSIAGAVFTAIVLSWTTACGQASEVPRVAVTTTTISGFSVVTTSPPVSTNGFRLISVGDTVVLDGLDMTLQVRAYERVGEKHFAIDVEACGGENPAEDASINQDLFQLQITDETRRIRSVDMRRPALGKAPIQPSQCISGWTTFEVPGGQLPTSVIYQVPGQRPVRWTV
jgi:hypothetical protein